MYCSLGALAFEPAFEFGKCLEHSKNHMIDDLPTHNNYLLT